jgi:hypothetical protein
MLETFLPETKLREAFERSPTALKAKFHVENAFYFVLNRLSKPCSVKHGPLIAHFTHHKCGTSWFHNSFSRIARRFALNYQASSQDDLDSRTDIWFQWHSQVHLDTLPPYIGSHMIRDPRDVTVSAYFYHKWCDEKWCHIPHKEFGNRTYQEYLQSVSKEEGLLCEMTSKLEKWHTTGSIIDAITSWNYETPFIMEVKYEDLILNPRQLLQRLFRHYGFNEQEIVSILKIFDAYSFQRRTRRQLGEENPRSHMRKGIPGDWKCHFTKQHRDIFKDLYGDALIRLGYENDKEW